MGAELTGSSRKEAVVVVIVDDLAPIRALLVFRHENDVLLVRLRVGRVLRLVDLVPLDADVRTVYNAKTREDHARVG